VWSHIIETTTVIQKKERQNFNARLVNRTHFDLPVARLPLIESGEHWAEIILENH